MSRRYASDDNAFLPVALGTIAWLASLVYVTAVTGVQPEEGQVWWFAVTVIGSLSGIFGLVFLRWRMKRKRERA
jgi:membrane protein DedA with SNARE-associated domain